MKNPFSKVSVLFSTLLILGSVHASQPTTFLGPSIKAGYTDTFTNTSGYSIAGEVGVKNYRASGTLGWQLEQAQRFKITGEYLAQKITYNFFLGDTQQWVNQGALGAKYEYDFANYALNPQFDLAGYYSHAPSKTLSVATGRIAGSNAGGIAPGVTIKPWSGARAGVDLNYDRVTYNTNAGVSKDANGLGGTARFNQALIGDLDLGLVAGFRQPFNNYQANLNWTTDSSAGEWIWGLGGEYTVGKNSLPSTYNVIASVNFLLDRGAPEVNRHRSLKGDYKDEVVAPDTYDFRRWVADPAVRMPQVLAIAQDSVPPGCGIAAPSFLSTIASPPLFTTSGTLPVASHFGGSSLVYSLTQVTPFTVPGTSAVTINSTTGVLSIFDGHPPLTTSATFTVTATNCAGSVTSNVFTITVV